MLAHNVPRLIPSMTTTSKNCKIWITQQYRHAFEPKIKRPMQSAEDLQAVADGTYLKTGKWSAGNFNAKIFSRYYILAKFDDTIRKMALQTYTSTELLQLSPKKNSPLEVQKEIIANNQSHFIDISLDFIDVLKQHIQRQPVAWSKLPKGMYGGGPATIQWRRGTSPRAAQTVS